MSSIRTESQGMSWDVQSTETARGTRYRYYCHRCGTAGRWWINPNDADGDAHLASKHGEG